MEAKRMTRPNLLTLTETAAAMGVSIPTYYRKAKRGDVPDSIMLAGVRFSNPEAVTTWKAQRTKRA
jgi:predicted DNA-binding transcriptional regulator AlpA